MTTSTRALALLGLLGLVGMLGACSLLPDAAVAVAGEWRLVEGTGPDGPVPLPAEAVVTLRFGDEGFGGTAACNSYGGTHELDGTALRFGDTFVTEMGCEQPLMATEQAYLAALADVRGVADADDERLVLEGPASRLVYLAVAPPPTAALVDTRWELDGLLTGVGDAGAVSSVQGEGYLLLHADGTVEADTGCRALRGEWVEDGATIALPSFGAVDAAVTCPPELAQQDDAVVAVLGDGFRAEVDGQRLELRDARDPGRGLSFRAAG